MGTTPPVTTPAPTTTPTYVDVDEGGGIGLLPILIGLAALGALVYFLVKNGDEEPPISP